MTIQAIEGQEKHLEVLQKLEPHFDAVFKIMEQEMHKTSDVSNAMVFMKTAMQWVQTCVVTSLKLPEKKEEQKRIEYPH
ncbi:MAG: hypothetical protein ACYC6W_11090 [Nitrosotalea sp.]